MDVLIVGAGSMGRWFGGVCRDADLPGSLEGTAGDAGLALFYADRDPAVAAGAAAEVDGEAIDSFDRSGVPDSFDVVCIAVPIPAVREAIAAHAHRARHAILDLSGTMADPVEALSTHAGGVEWCSLHPLFAPANEPGNVPVVVGEDGPVTAALRGELASRGNHVFETTPEEHDAAMGTVQARAHAAILAYGLASDPVPDRFGTAVSRELDALVEQVGGGDPRVYADIQEAFDGSSAVAEAAQQLAEADHERFLELYTTLQDGTEGEAE